MRHIISYNSPKLIKNVIVFKNRKKDYKLMLAKIAIYYIKGKKSFNKLVLFVV
jgi:hypothetical protein